MRTRRGRASTRVVLTLAGVLGLNGADAATVSASAAQLQQAFDLSPTRLGLLVSVVPLAGGLGSLVTGVLADRTRRVRLIWVSVGLWALATLLGAAAASYPWLLVSRVALGAVTATAGPPVTSLVGDLFPARHRARRWGQVLAGELVGTGVGILVSGELASLLSWRLAFGWLVLPAAAVAVALRRLPEPRRGGQDLLAPDESGPEDPAAPDEPAPEDPAGTAGLAVRAAQRRGVRPRPRLVLAGDPAGYPWWWTMGYVLRVPTNLVLVIASALGYAYFEGLRTFALVFATEHYGIPQAVATPLLVLLGVGALIGVVLAGRGADRLLRRGWPRARVLLPAVCLLAIAPVAAPAFLTTSLTVALPLLCLVTALLGAVNAPLDAARLDVVPFGMWGRAEAARTLVRRLAEAAAPTLFGALAAVLGSPEAPDYVATFLLCALALLLAGALALLALRTYLRDVATAAASHPPLDPPADSPSWR